jgi:hypothetical protein
MQRNFEPMRKQVEAWQRSALTDVTAKVVIYEALVAGRREAQRDILPTNSFRLWRNLPKGSLRPAVVCGRPSKPNFMSYSSDKARSMLAQRVISFRRVHFSIGFVKQLV